MIAAWLAITACDEAAQRGSCDDKAQCVADATIVSFPGCNPLEQSGCAIDEKCTWIIDRGTPDYHGLIGCVPTGDKASGAACTFSSTSAGSDDCVAGLICSNFYGQPGVCTPICRLASSEPPSCHSGHRCTFSGGILTVDERNEVYGAGYCE